MAEPDAAPRHTSFPRPKMLPPLSPLTYYRRNITRTLPVGGAIVISVFLIASIVTLLNSVDASIVANYGFVRRFSVLAATPEEQDVSARVVAKARRDPHVTRIIDAVPYFVVLRTIFGEMPVPIYGVDPADLKAVAALTGNRLVQGRWPEPGEPEVVMTRTWANNFGRGVGEWIDSRRGRLTAGRKNRRQKLVGILEGGENIALTDRDYLLSVLPFPAIRTSHLLIPQHPGQVRALNHSVNAILSNYKKHGLTAKETEYVKLYTFDGLVQELRESLRFLYKFLAIADGLVIGAVALLSGFLANIYFEQRLGEFGLLSAFGFRREKLAYRLIIETGSLVVLSWIVGLALTYLGFRTLDAYYMSPRGLILAQMDRLAILYTIPTPVIVGVASLATVLLRLYRMDPIEIMERR